MRSRLSSRALGFTLGAAVALVALAIGAAPAEAGGKKGHKPAPADDDRDGARGACSRSANSLLSACRLELSVDAFETRAKCVNLADAEDRAECLGEIDDARSEGAEECRDQHEARRDLCEEIGEAPYEPDMDPALFQDPRNPSRTNPWFPLAVGNRWVFEEGSERVEIEVLDQTKRIAGVDCIVVNDRVSEDGLVVEDTDDWFGLRTDGSVEYCGELSRDYEVFAGDDPENPQLVSIEGTFKADVDGAKSGTIFMATPVVGTSYRQEWSATEAEDVGTVLSTTYRYGVNAFLDQAVPRALAELMCANGDCVVVADTSTLSPDAYEHKYFAKGVGLFLETNPSSGNAAQLIACSHDPRCASLPLP
ncbi:MAG: hypothetical protein ACHQ6V_06665 [Myxococcota bacterium]|jgi:hypothetical protein